jgi:Protein of unknwon function (DUF3310)
VDLHGDHTGGKEAYRGSLTEADVARLVGDTVVLKCDLTVRGSHLYKGYVGVVTQTEGGTTVVDFGDMVGKFPVPTFNLGMVPPEPSPEPHDNVNRPSHYTTHPSGVECIDIVEHMTFNVGNAIKYLWRAGRKDSAPLVEDLRKAAWYVTREIERVERGKK